MPPYEFAARKRALEVLTEFEITACPVDPDAIASARGIEVTGTGEFPRHVCGALVKDGNTFSILVSAHCPNEGHRRFTLSHELGHFFIDGHINALFAGDQRLHLSGEANFRGRKNPFEIEADAFASELLLPTPLARPAVRLRSASIHGIQAVAEQFQTSLSCAAIRFAALTAEPMAVLLSHERTLEWVAFSDPLRDQAWSRRRWKGEWAPRGSATVRLGAKPDRIQAGEQDSETGLLASWFEGAPAVEAVEEALGLGSYGRVLTVLGCPDLPPADEIHQVEQEGRKESPDWRARLRTYSFDDY